MPVNSQFNINQKQNIRITQPGTYQSPPQWSNHLGTFVLEVAEDGMSCFVSAPPGLPLSSLPVGGTVLVQAAVDVGDGLGVQQVTDSVDVTITPPPGPPPTPLTSLSLVADPPVDK